jgi:hypothetical protein
MQISNVRRIIVEDFPEKERDSIGKLATVLNSFMEEVVDLSRNNISYDNLARAKVVLDLVLNASGIPKGVTQINTTLPSISGAIIINAQVLQGGGPNVISSPYLDYSNLGNGTIKINKFHGLPENKKMRITIEFIA